MNKIKYFYERNNKNIIIPIATCVSEIISNFWYHAIDSTDTYVLVEGNVDIFKLYIIDTGCRGIS